MSTASPAIPLTSSETAGVRSGYHGKRIYFKNLNGFRFLAASGVIITHIELYKARVGAQNIWKHPLVFELGSAAVDFFFVLSGFLITYLLLEEKRQFKKINFRLFYTRRILRIWPLYYFVILMAFFVIPHLPIMYTRGYSDDLFINHIPKLISSLLQFVFQHFNLPEFHQHEMRGTLPGSRQLEPFSKIIADILDAMPEILVRYNCQLVFMQAISRHKLNKLFHR